jgi:hypothetical protein
VAGRYSLWAAVAAALVVSIASSRSDVAGPKDQQAFDFLIQKVCVDRTDRAIPSDPYRCPAGDTLRALRPGEALPYHRFDQPLADRPDARQRRDSYPVRLRSGEIEVVSTFDRVPFDHFKPDRDGYSLTVVREGWVSSGGTRSRNLGTTFFGAGCKPYNGWIYFPVSALNGRLIDPGDASLPIGLDHWEKNAEPWPGRCPAPLAADWVTSWEPFSGFAFGGPGAATSKSIDAIRSIHGFANRPSFMANGHLEIFYFTRIYGFTRWETWVPRQRYDADAGFAREADIADEACSGPRESVYKGVKFERTACRDWTSVVTQSAPDPPPNWPVPGLQ